jgi:hypothetical protein
VTFTSDTSALLELINISALSVITANSLDPGVFSKPKGINEVIIADIQKFVDGSRDIKAAALDWIRRVQNVNRVLGPAGIWDIGESNIYAGLTPATMAVPDIQPYTDMLNWTGPNNAPRPLLTRDLADNPEPPQSPPNMHTTHYDLRSLVAQALYDPGVLPPSPDTSVALPNAEL